MKLLGNYLKKFLLTNKYDQSCYTNFNQFRTLIWDTAMNDTIKATLFKIYLTQSNNINYIQKFCHIASNEAMTNEIFSTQLIREKTHYIIFEKCDSAKSKWLMYSCFWNLFRYQDIRNKISNNFVQKIIDDIDDILEMDDQKVYNVFIGCLSNLALKDNHKINIHKMLINLNHTQLEKLLIIDEKRLSFFTSLFGLLCNIAVNDDLVDELIESELFSFIIKHWNQIINLVCVMESSTMIRNSLSLLNNLINHPKLIELFIEYQLYNTLLKIEYYHDNSEVVDPNLVTLLPNITSALNIQKFSDTTNLHLANNFDKIKIVLNHIIVQNKDINIVDNLGNTILHNALQSNQLENACIYILCDANIHQLNEENIDPKTINKDFVENVLTMKKRIHNDYKKTITKTVDTKHYLYEKYIIDEINDFIDIRPDIYAYVLDNNRKTII